MPKNPKNCLECGVDLKKVAPRQIINVTLDAQHAPNKDMRRLVGPYCGPTCALDAYDRGLPKRPHERPTPE